MAWTAPFVNGEIPTHAKLNQMLADDAAWGGNVNAGGFNLSNLGNVTAAGQVAITSPITFGAVVDVVMSDTTGGGPGGVQIQATGSVTATAPLLKALGQGATPVFRVQNDGKVGIGTATPATTLHVSGASTAEIGEIGSLLVTGGSLPYRLVIGYNSSSGNGYGWIQTVRNGVAPTTLWLNRNGGGVGIGLANAPIYANNAAAIAGGLTAGMFYRTGADPDHICIVH